MAATMQQLFGSTSALTSADLPCNLDHLVAQLPPGRRHRVDDLIDGHTLLPLFTPFLAPERAAKMRSQMHGDGGGGVHFTAGIGASDILFPRQYRFCPACVAADRDEFGETYWHRIHQVPGVLVCPSHAVFLEDAPAALRAPHQAASLASAERAVLAVPPRQADADDLLHSQLLWLARDLSWLMNQRKLSPGLAVLKERYAELLCRRGLASYRGTVVIDRLRLATQGGFPPGLLQLVGCEIDAEVEDTWLTRLCRGRRPVHGAVRHVLLMHLLGTSAADFFASRAQRQPFGPGPWPCLNPAAAHCGQLIVTECVVESDRPASKLRGTFTCDCGLIYVRHGPDQNPSDRSRRDSVIAYGPVWDAKLRELWADPSHSQRSISRLLGVH